MRSLLEKEARCVVLHGTCLILSLHVQRRNSRVVVVLLHDVARVPARLTQGVGREISDWLLSRELFANVAEGAQGLRLNVGERLILGNAVYKHWYLRGTLVNLRVHRTWSSLKNTSLSNQLVLWTNSLA